MKYLTALILILFVPVFGHAALLKYEFVFGPTTYWPIEVPAPYGDGHLIANTELNAIVSGELVSDFFHFKWTAPAPTPITYGYDHYGADVVSGGSFRGIDVMSGVSGIIFLPFYLPPGLENYSEALDQHINYEDVYWDITFPNSGPPADQWEYYDQVWFDVIVFSPTVISETPEPATFVLLSLGLGAIIGARVRKIKT